MKRIPAHLTFRPETVRAATDAAGADLPAGVIGRVEGWALVYDEIDGHGTTFVRGCLDRTKRERVAAGKVQLFWDHGKLPSEGMYDTDLHVGVVRSLTTKQLPDGRWGEWLVADLFDTEKAHEAHRYVRAVLETGSVTGLSIGMDPKHMRGEARTVDGRKAYAYIDVALREVSITAIPSVPGTTVTTVRADAPGAAERTTQRLAVLNGVLAGLDRATVRCALEAAGYKFVPDVPNSDMSSENESNTGSNAEATDTPAETIRADAGAQDSAAPTTHYATMDERLTAVRQSYA